VGPLLATGELVRVLAPWVAGQVHLYAALPSRQYLPRRTRVFLDYLTEQTALMLADAQAVCGGMSGLR
jgi:DNA-binding transcriptional LysR family regulator